MKRILCIFAVLALFCACQPDRPDDTFVNSVNVKLRMYGRTVMEYDPMNCQMSYEPAERRFVVTDDRGARFYQVTMSDIPVSHGQSIKADLVWTANTGTRSKSNVALDVFKVEGDRIWLWNQKLNIEVSLILLD